MYWIDQIDTAIQNFLRNMSDVDPWLCLALLLALLILETSLFVGMIIPGEAAVLVTAGALGNSWAPVLFVVIVLASVLGQNGGYALGTIAGPRLRGSWVGRKIGEERWENAEAVVQGSGGWALITTRFVPFIHAVTPAVAGTLGIPYRRFLLLATIGASLWSAVLTLATVALGEAAEVFGYGWIGLLLTAIGSVGAVTSITRAVRGLREKRAAANPTDLGRTGKAGVQSEWTSGQQ